MTENKSKPTSEENLLKKPIILFGTGRSGTTIISDIIFQHEDLAWHSNYQEMFPRFAAINYLRRIFDNKYWRKIGINTQNNTTLINKFYFTPIEKYGFWKVLTGTRVDFLYDFLLNQRATPSEAKHIRSFFAKMIKYQKRKRLAFKITGPARMEYLMSIFPDAMFVQIKRNPVSTIRSWLGVPFWKARGVKQLFWTGAYTPEEEKEANNLISNPALFSAVQYKKLMETTDYEINKMNPAILRVAYETFIKDPKKCIDEILLFLNLPQSKLIDKYLVKIAIKDRNTASSSSADINEETKKEILELVNAP